MLAILIALALVRRIVVPTNESTRALLVDFVFSCAQAFLLTPYLIAVHRGVILNERTSRYALAPGEHRFQLFFMWSIALSLMYWIPSFGVEQATDGPPSLPIAALMIALIAAAIVSVIVSLRLIILFPAIAVDAPGTTWANTMADTRGNAWRIFLICLVTMLPLFAVALVVVIVLGATEATQGALAVLSRIIGAIAEGAGSLLGATIAVVIASRLYLELGDRVNQ
jgi:hypothetical protein